METIKLFLAPHKALRKVMAEFLVLAGQTNFNKHTDIEKLKKSGNVCFTLLSSHADTEDKFIFSALDAKIKGAASHNKAQHVELEKLQEELKLKMQILSKNTTLEEAYRFYLQVSKFQIIYLDHMLEEEIVTQEIIWENLSVKEQLAIRRSIIQKMNPETCLLWLKNIIAAQNEAENLPVMEAIQQCLLPDRYSTLLQNLKEQLPSKVFENLNKKEMAYSFQ